MHTYIILYYKVKYAIINMLLFYLRVHVNYKASTMSLDL